MAERKRKETDYEALGSAFMKIPRMRVEAARALLNLELREVYQLVGRSPEVLWAEIKRIHADMPDDFLPYLRMAVYYAENGDEAKASLMHPSAWQ